MPRTTVDRLRSDVLDRLKERFVGRDDVIELIALAIVAGEHLFLHGPPGTAKSALIRQFALLINGRYFEYLLTRFSEPNEVFGPIDLIRLREGEVATVTKGMLPESEFVFLDELFNANSAILNSLLSVLNERVYRRGAETHQLPLLSLFAASNHLPEDDALQALFDRFLLRCHVSPLKREDMPALLSAGWALERPPLNETALSADDLRALSAQVLHVDLSGVLEPYTELIFKMRDLGIGLTDRRAVKALKLVAASALLAGRKAAQLSDLWPLRYLWDREEQIGLLGTVVNGALVTETTQSESHPMARPMETGDADEIARRIASIQQQMENGRLSLVQIARVREEVANLADKAAWLADEEPRQHLLGLTTRILETLG